MTDHTDLPEGVKQPSLTLLIKLLGMTTSSNDNEALVAMRKANAEVLKFPGGTWQALLSGKVKVIGDPFANLAEPKKSAEPEQWEPPPMQTAPTSGFGSGMSFSANPYRGGGYRGTTQQAPRPQQAPRQAPPPPPPPKPVNRPNKFAARCRICNTYIGAGAGQLVKSASGWLVQCAAGTPTCVASGPTPTPPGTKSNPYQAPKDIGDVL